MNADEFGELCLGFQGATVNVQWENDRVYKIGGKMFGCSGLDPGSRYSFKVDDERFLELTDRDGVVPAPYLARAKWIQVEPAECALSNEELQKLVQRSYELVFSKLTKKAQREILGN